MLTLKMPYDDPEILIKGPSAKHFINILIENKEKLGLVYKLDAQTNHTFIYKQDILGYKHISFVLIQLHEEIILFSLHVGKDSYRNGDYVALAKKICFSFRKELKQKFQIEIKKVEKPIRGRTIDVLERFILMANKKNISTNDWGRYYDFIKSSYRYKCKLPKQVLEETLINAKFSENNVKELVNIYSHGMGILEHKINIFYPIK